MDDRAYTCKTLLVSGADGWRNWERYEKTLDDFFRKQLQMAVEKEKWTIAHTGEPFAAKYCLLKGYKAQVYRSDPLKDGSVGGYVFRNVRIIERAKPSAAILFQSAGEMSNATRDCLRRLKEYSRMPVNRLWSIMIVNESPHSMTGRYQPASHH